MTDPSSSIAEVVDPGYLQVALCGGAWADGRFSGPPLLPRLVMLDLWARAYDLEFAP